MISIKNSTSLTRKQEGGGSEQPTERDKTIKSQRIHSSDQAKRKIYFVGLQKPDKQDTPSANQINLPSQKGGQGSKYIQISDFYSNVPSSKNNIKFSNFVNALSPTSPQTAPNSNSRIQNKNLLLNHLNECDISTQLPQLRSVSTQKKRRVTSVQSNASSLSNAQIESGKASHSFSFEETNNEHIKLNKQVSLSSRYSTIVSDSNQRGTSTRKGQEEFYKTQREGNNQINEGNSMLSIQQGEQSPFQQTSKQRNEQMFMTTTNESNRDQSLRFYLDRDFITAFQNSEFSRDSAYGTLSPYRQKKQAQKHLMQSRISRKSNRQSFIMTSDNFLSSKENTIQASPGQQSTPTTFAQRKRPSSYKYPSAQINASQIEQEATIRWKGFLEELEYSRSQEDLFALIDETLKELEENNYEALLPYLIELLSRTVDQNDLKLFQATVDLMAELAYEMGNIDVTAFMMDQCRQMYTLTESHQKKSKAILGLARCARSIQAHQEAIQLLKRALEFSWKAGDVEGELEVYDEIGRNYLFLGQTARAKYYHSRYVNGEIERDDSIQKVFSQENLKAYFNTIPYTFTEVSSLLLTYLKIPLFTLDQMKQYGNIIHSNYLESGQTPRAKVLKQAQLDFHKCNVREIISRVINEKEFQEIIDSPRSPFQTVGKERSVNQANFFENDDAFLDLIQNKRKVQIPSRLCEGKSSKIYDTNRLGVITYCSNMIQQQMNYFNQVIDQEYKSRDFSNPFKYKVSLEKKIEYLVKQIPDFEIASKLEKVRKFRYEQRDHQHLRDRVYMNSSKWQVKGCSTKIIITHNYKNMFKTFFIDYLEGQAASRHQKRLSKSEYS